MQKDANESNFKDLFTPLTNTKCIVFLFILGLITYFNSLFNNFIGDDYGQILYNPTVHSLLNIPLFFKISTFALGNGIGGIYYKPLLLIVYTLLYSLFGPVPFYFHFLQLILFISNAILFFIFLNKFIPRSSSFVLATIFLVHPINQATASYIADLQDTLFFFFGISAMVLSLKSTYKYSQILEYFFLCLSLLSKESGMLFVIMYVLYKYFFKKHEFKISAIIASVILVSYIFAHYMAVGTQFASSNFAHISRLPLSQRLINIPEIIVFYLQKFLFPLNLAIHYDWVVMTISFLSFYLPLIIVLVVFFCLLYGSKIVRQKNQKLYYGYIFFLIWFILGLCLHVQVIPLDATVSTAWFYFPIAGLLGLLGIYFYTLVQNKSQREISTYLAFIVILIFIGLTIIRNSEYKDNLTITCHDADETYNDYSLENSCGSSLAIAGFYPEAKDHLLRSAQLAPYYYASWYSLGTVVGIEGSQTHNMKLIYQAENDFQTSIKIDPNIPSYYELLGYLYINYNAPTTTIPYLYNALSKYPDDSKLWLYLAIAEYKDGQLKNSESAIKKAYLLNPNNPAIISEYQAIRK